MSDLESSALVSFYRSTGRDDRGRTLDEILAWDDRALEGVHDYIQWLFPLDQRSAFNAGAPLVSASERGAFRNDERLRAGLKRALVRMLAFYGLRIAGDRIERAKNWPERSRVWLTPYNHNYLRLTRIIRSLALLGEPELARALRTALIVEYERAPGVIGETTLRFWKAAGD